MRGGATTPDEVRALIVVFGEPGNMVLLGAIGLESLNLKLDLDRKELVPAGPVPVARSSLRNWPSPRVRHTIHS